MVKESSTEVKKSNKIVNASLRVLNILVIIISIGLGRAYPLPATILGLVYFSILLGVTINRRNVAKAKNDDTKQFTSGIVGYSVFTGFLLILLFFLVWQLGGLQATSTDGMQSPDQLASTAVQEAKAQTTFPQVEDSVTDATDITSEGNTIVYHEQIHDADVSAVTNASLQSLVQPKVCANTSMTSLLKDGINIEYLYTVKETGEQFTVNIEESDC